MSEYKNVPFVPCNDCANYESCTNDFVADLLEPYDVESIEDLITNVRNKAIDDLVRLVCEYYTMQERAGYCADTNNMIKQRIADFGEQLKGVQRMTITEINPNVLYLEYRQEKEDKDYGSCLWARFVFNLDRYELSITSDCGNYAYKWCETPKAESFLQLMSRTNKDYMLDKLYGRADIFDYEATKGKIYEWFGEDEEDKEKLDEIFDEMEIYGGYPDNASEFMRVFEDNNNNDFCDVWETLQYEYPANALKIVEVFNDCIQPYIREKLKGGADNGEE